MAKSSQKKQTQKYLWVTIADNMTWNTHSEQTAAKENKKLGFLKRNLKINNSDIKIGTYNTLVRPTLEYCSMVWDPHTARDGPMLGCQIGEE